MRKATRIPHDWNLPNADLSLIWKIPPAVVVRLRREAGGPAPLWRLQMPGTREDPDYLKALEAERALAAAARAPGNEPVKTRER